MRPLSDWIAHASPYRLDSLFLPRQPLKPHVVLPPVVIPAGKLDFFFDTACVEGNLVLRHDGRVELTDITESHPLQEFADYVRAAVAMAMCYPMRDADGVPVTVTMRYRCIITHDGSPQVLTDDTSIVATQRSLDE
ncbi:MAG TPA: hypothetical protein PK186_11765 [candidate division Zixibacteria bacterium]|nr:hypothetical protein [candidate division Zixibacteria bacterium]MDD4917985.1 hypothetical protein [candidate division Zixibacteria bacterium]MDM7972463.1 hypothetical protein [candidate division Zixibacteria bacterium]HOD66704.1 hypothetical protein [candidate division Zixibacteria bacterium]HPC11465.1 hypothetical protein [candidate division Zixibacteria bacterium]